MSHIISESRITEKLVRVGTLKPGNSFSIQGDSFRMHTVLNPDNKFIKNTSGKVYTTYGSEVTERSPDEEVVITDIRK